MKCEMHSSSEIIEQKYYKNVDASVRRSILTLCYRTSLFPRAISHIISYSIQHTRSQRSKDKVATDIGNEARRLSTDPRNKHTDVVFVINRQGITTKLRDISRHVFTPRAVSRFVSLKMKDHKTFFQISYVSYFYHEACFLKIIEYIK